MTTKLKFLGLKPRTLQSYQKALHHFFDWLESGDYRIPARFTELDARLAQYLEHMWLDDFNITYAGHTLSALRRFHPQSRYRLPLSRQYFTNWKSVHVCQQAVPMPAVVAAAIAGLAWTMDDTSFAVTVLLGFAAFLRTGEMISLKHQDIAVDLESTRIILALPATKTSKQVSESVELLDSCLCPLVHSVLKPGTTLPFCGLTANQFRARLKVYLNFFALLSFNFTAYSLRRGGASHCFATGTHFDDLLLRGRWQSVKTARIYLDSGRASLVRMAFAAEVESQLLVYQEKLFKVSEQLRRKRSKRR